ncbi:hypothetical protein OAQ84_00230 [Bdellovibrionales bacterium]|nr:hypothetical protein [Bdellovibrionales bacterium]
MKWRLNTAQFDINPGQRAFIYQQLAEFDPFLLSNSTVSVEIAPSKGEKLATNKEPPADEVSITITLMSDETQVSATSVEPDVISATTSAKKKLLDFLYEVHEEVLRLESMSS